MRTWHTAKVNERCGRCGHTIPKGAIYQALTLLNIRRAKRRCHECADGQPHDIDAKPKQPAFKTSPAPLMPMLQKFLEPKPIRDGKALACAEREPGEDDE